jgi:hypothetical protein
MDIDFIAASPSGPASTLLVLVPGLNMRHGEFVEHGFVDVLRGSARACDVLLVEPELDSYLDGTVASGLGKLIVEKRADGYSQVCVAGISLGCFGALFAAAFGARDAIDRAILLSPFLGTPGLIAEVERAGGLRLWEPGPIAANDGERRVLHWLQGHTRIPERTPVLHLGYGAGDRFAPASALLAAALPQSRTHVIDGGHDWPTWERLWRHILAADPFDEVRRVAGRPAH